LPAQGFVFLTVEAVAGSVRPPREASCASGPLTANPALKMMLSLWNLVPLLLSYGALAGGSSDDVEGPHDVVPDEFHPARTTAVEPAYGGEVVVHLSSLPEGLNRATENSAVARWILYEVNDTLTLQDWEFWDDRPSLCKGWETEDQIVLKREAWGKYDQARRIADGEKEREVLYGAVSTKWGLNLDRGQDYSVRGVSEENPSTGGVTVAAEDVESVQRGTVFTFDLPTNVKWHDGHAFDAWDVYFSWDLYNNSAVDCDEIRFQYQQILSGEVVHAHKIRFFFEKQYMQALRVPGEMAIMPRHLYDLTDPDNKRYDPDYHAHAKEQHGEGYEFTLAELGDYINDNPHNTAWVGLGPYRVVEWGSQGVKAVRFEDYHDPSQAGYVDQITWRYISDDNSAFQALINGELDYFARVKSEDYFGEGTAKSSFTDDFYKGYFYTGTYGYSGWNTLRPQLSDPMVRKALELAFDWPNYIKTEYHGLAKRVTGPQNYFGPGYNRSVKPHDYDPDTAEELLAEAGWYDRDGDGIIDKDGVKFEIEFLFPSGNEASRKFGLRMQQSYEPLGIKVEMRNFEWSTFLERMLERNFDAVNLAWVPPLESDPEQLWHSKWGKPELKSSNMCGIMDPHIDDLIERGQVELDGEKRAKLWQELHRYIYDEVQPYMFGANTPRKFAMTKKLRGFEAFKISPGYLIRRWYYPAGTPGTRSSLAKN
jgi:peptide/nickel transport system substrate-binding protein